MEEEFKSSISKKVEELLVQCGLPEDFWRSLDKEDDWSYIIKLHALIEAAANQCLTKILADDRLEPIITCLEMSDKRRGKLAILKALDLVFKEIRAFINALSELRNELIHNIRNVTFRFSEAHSGSLKEKVEQLGRACAKDGLPDDGKYIEAYRILFKHSPRCAINSQARWTIALLATEAEKGELRRQILTLYEQNMSAPK